MVQLCGKEVYGVYSIVFNTLSIVAMFCYAWIGQSYIRFHSQNKNYFYTVCERLLKKSLLIGFFIFVPLTIVITPISIVDLLFFIPTFFLFGYYCFLVLVFQAKKKAMLIMFCEITRTVVNIISAILLLKFFNDNYSIKILAIALFLSYLIPLLILILNTKHQTNKINIDEVNILINQIKKFGIPIAFFISASLALSVNDRFILSYLVNKESAGTYAAIYDVINKGVIAIFSPILMTFYPVIAKLYNQNKEDEVTLKLRKLIILEIGLMTLGFIILATICPYLLKFVFKHDTSKNLYYVALLIFIGVCLWQIALLTHKKLELREQTKYMAIAVFISFLINLITNYFLLQTSTSLVIPAITTIVSSIIYILLVQLFSNKISTTNNLVL